MAMDTINKHSSNKQHRNEIVIKEILLTKFQSGEDKENQWFFKYLWFFWIYKYMYLLCYVTADKLSHLRMVSTNTQEEPDVIRGLFIINLIINSDLIRSFISLFYLHVHICIINMYFLSFSFPDFPLTLFFV